MASSSEDLRKELITYAPARSRWLVYWMGCLLFVGLGVFLMVIGHEDERIFAAICLLVFGFALILLTRELLKPTVGIRIDEEGIHQTALLPGQSFDLRWDEIERVHFLEGRSLASVVVVPVNLESYYNRCSPFARYLGRINNELVGGPICFGGPIIPISSSELAKLIQERLNP